MTTTGVQIGLLAVTIDQESKNDRDFLDGLDDGMRCYCECDIASDDPCLSYTESLVHKHATLYRDLVIQIEEAAAEQRLDAEPLPLTLPESAIIMQRVSR